MGQERKSLPDSVRAQSSQTRALGRAGIPPPPTSSKEVSGGLKSFCIRPLLNFRNGFPLRSEKSWKYNVKGLFQPRFPNGICNVQGRRSTTLNFELEMAAEARQ